MKIYSAIAVSGALAFSLNAGAEAIIGPQLTDMLASDFDSGKVIITTHQKQQLDNLMQSLNLPYLSLESLPVAGTTLSKTQIENLAQDDRVYSIYYDAPLEYYNYTSGEITGGHYVHDIEGVTGHGTTIAVLDSGVDGTHPDLTYGSKLLQNVKIVGDLDLAGGVNLFLEGVLNSDTSSGHGTHVAGTVAGSGAASADNATRPYYHDGIAPNATMVGIGAGDAISILYALAGFDYAISNQERYGIDVITNSWGGGDGANFDPNNPINQASYQAYRQGIVVTFAASNSGPDEDTLNQYAIAPWVINVAAGTAERELADFSSRGVAGDPIKAPDVTAPGSNIVSTRGANTVLPILGPILDPEHPDYHLYYASMSGTSMATPFVAGVVGLLLEVNPQLSPDQIESIIRQTADPMAGYQFHQVGDGYINVAAAVAEAQNTEGQRAEFLDGDTRWSSQGEWQEVAENDPYIDYISRWKTKTSTLSDDGSYTQSRRKSARLMFDFIGDSIKFNYLAHPKGGHAEVYLNGQSRGYIDYYAEQSTAKTFALRDLDPQQVHSVELRHSNGRINFDGLMLDGQLVDNGTQIEVETSSFSGSIGPSAENLETAEHPFMVSADTVSLDAVLSWEVAADLDFELVDPEGAVVATSATLENPEIIGYRPQQAGEYRLRVKGYLSVNTPYTIELETSKMVSN